MKTKDIQPGAEYAYARAWEWNRSPRGAHRARVVAVQQPREAWSTGYGSHTLHDGVRVEFLNDQGEPVSSEVVRLADLHEPWDTYVVEEARRAGLRRAERERSVKHQESVRARLDAVFALIPDFPRPMFTDCKVWPDGSMTTHGDVTNAQLAALLEAVAVAGSEGDVRRCEGACGLVKPVTKFPTQQIRTGESEPRRGAECRACRDARVAASRG